MFKADVNVHTRLALRERVLDQPHLVELEDEDNTKLEEGAQGRSEMAGAEDTTMTGGRGGAEVEEGEEKTKSRRIWLALRAVGARCSLLRAAKEGKHHLVAACLAAGDELGIRNQVGFTPLIGQRTRDTVTLCACCST